MTRAALYARVSTVDQHHESQLLDLQQLAAHRGWEIVETYIDHGVSGTRTRRPALESFQEMANRTGHPVERGHGDNIEAMASSIGHEPVDEFNRLGVSSRRIDGSKAFAHWSHPLEHPHSRQPSRRRVRPNLH